MNDYIGRQFGPYQTLRLLGSGNFGAVYLAEHRYLETLVAIKILNVSIEGEKHDEFLHEARLNARLEHAHIIRIITFDFQDQKPYLVMEYVPNGTLRTLYPRGTCVPLEQITRYVKQIASALDYAHKHHVIHRDVKPENVLLNAKGEIVLSDFGIAVVQPSLSTLSTQNRAGTPLYMAPEQIQGHPCPASDQYALAVMVYEWLCGSPPFPGPGLAVYAQHLYQDPPALCARVPGLPREIEDAVFGALARDPAQRFFTVQDFANALDAACFATQPLSINGSKGNIPQELDDPTQPLHSVSLPFPAPAVRPTVRPISPLVAPHQPVAQQISFPVSVMCVCAPEDQVLLQLWEAHLHLLEQAGILNVWSASHLLAGASRLQQINQHLDQADLIFLLLSVDFFSSDECFALMQRSLQRQHEGATVVPLLLRPVEWNASPLASLSYIPSNGLPITSWMDRDAAFDLCARDIRRLLGYMGPAERKLPPVLVPSSIALRNRQILLRKVRSVWIEGVLHHSLHGAALLTLGLAKQPDAVANPWQLVFQQPETTPRPLPAGMSISQVYDQALGELLILGAPGSGKTTLLLELARDLLERAEHDEQHPMPVVFNLSTWATGKQPLIAWLADELKFRYGVPPKIAHALVAADQILPLLDGLDEVALQERTACIEAINTYKQEHGFLPLVVCSRSADYQAQALRIRLGCAVAIQPLQIQQVNDYLDSAGEGLRGLRVALQQDQALRELTHSPLLLSLLTLTYAYRPPQDVLRQPSSTSPIRQVVEHYVERMLTRGNESTDYTAQATRHWLSWLARQLQSHNQTIFYIEHMQPDWAEKPSTGKSHSRIAIGFLFALLGIVTVGPSLGGISLQLLANSLFQHFDPVLNVSLTLLFALIGGSFLGLVNALLYRQHTEKVSLTQAQLRWRQMREGISRSIINGLLCGLFIGCLPTIIAGSAQPIGLLVTGLTVGSTGGLVFGLIEVLLHIQPTSIQPADTVTWSWINMGRSVVKLSLIGLLCSLLIGLLLAMIVLVSDGFPPDQIIGDLLFGLHEALSYAPFFALIGAVLGCLIGGLSHTVLDRRNTAIPNEGIRRSARFSLRIGLVGIFGTAMLASILSLLAMLINNQGLWDFVFIIVFIGPLITLVSALRVGGIACIQHAVLRWLLWRDHVMPWHYARFLDHAAGRILLQKVGGGYMFVHRFVLEYFAELERL